MYKLIKYGYLVVSGFSFLVVCFYVLLAIYSYSPMAEKTEPVSKKEAIFVLNHGHIVTDQNYDVIYSYKSRSHPLGDHIEYYCLEVEKFELQPNLDNDWVIGPETNKLFIEAREMVASIGKMSECFAGEVNSNSESILANIWTLRSRRAYVTGGRIILFHVPTNRVLYVSFET